MQKKNCIFFYVLFFFQLLSLLCIKKLNIPFDKQKSATIRENNSKRFMRQNGLELADICVIRIAVFEVLVLIATNLEFFHVI